MSHLRIGFRPAIIQPVKENKRPAGASSNCGLITHVAIAVLLLIGSVSLLVIGGLSMNPPMLSIGVSLLGALIIGGLKKAVSYR